MNRVKPIHPEVRTGNCCGELCRPGRFDTLYKVPNIYRYRCALCWEHEVGSWHHAAPQKAVILRARGMELVPTQRPVEDGTGKPPGCTYPACACFNITQCATMEVACDQT